MIKRRDYNFLHKNHDGESSSESEDEEEEVEAQGSEEGYEASSSDEGPAEEFIGRPGGEISEEDMRSGDEDDGETATALEPESELERAAVGAGEVVAVPSKTGRVFKCRICAKVLCLNVLSLEQHLNSRRHTKSQKRYTAGELKQCVDSEGEDIGDEAETHAERHARILQSAVVKDQAGKTKDRKKKSGRQRQRERQRLKSGGPDADSSQPHVVKEGKASKPEGVQAKEKDKGKPKVGQPKEKKQKRELAGNGKHEQAEQKRRNDKEKLTITTVGQSKDQPVEKKGSKPGGVPEKRKRKDREVAGVGKAQGTRRDVDSRMRESSNDSPAAKKPKLSAEAHWSNLVEAGKRRKIP